MGEMGDDWRSVRPILKEESQQRRQRNRDRSASVLTVHSVAFHTLNGGAHLVIEHAGKTVDFWPGTGLYAPRGTTKRGRGVFNLLRFLGVPVLPTPQGGES